MKRIIVNFITAASLLGVGFHILINGYVWNMNLSKEQQLLIGGVFVAAAAYTLTLMAIDRKKRK